MMNNIKELMACNEVSPLYKTMYYTTNKLALSMIGLIAICVIGVFVDVNKDMMMTFVGLYVGFSFFICFITSVQFKTKETLREINVHYKEDYLKIMNLPTIPMEIYDVAIGLQGDQFKELLLRKNHTLYVVTMTRVEGNSRYYSEHYNERETFMLKEIKKGYAQDDLRSCKDRVKFENMLQEVFTDGVVEVVDIYGCGKFR